MWAYPVPSLLFQRLFLPRLAWDRLPQRLQVLKHMLDFPTSNPSKIYFTHEGLSKFKELVNFPLNNSEKNLFFSTDKCTHTWFLMLVHEKRINYWNSHHVGAFSVCYQLMGSLQPKLFALFFFAWLAMLLFLLPLWALPPVMMGVHAAAHTCFGCWSNLSTFTLYPVCEAAIVCPSYVCERDGANNM